MPSGHTQLNHVEIFEQFQRGYFDDNLALQSVSAGACQKKHENMIKIVARYIVDLGNLSNVYVFFPLKIVKQPTLPLVSTPILAQGGSTSSIATPASAKAASTPGK